MTNKRTFLIVDISNMMHRARHVSSGNIWDQLGITIHIMLNSIRKSWIKSNADHVVFCLDGKSWRKAIYEPYKANRDADKAKKTPDEVEADQIFFAGIAEFTNFVSTQTNCTVLQHEICEADDLIARFVQNHPNDEHIIISGDTDFIQLLNDNVIIYDGVREIILKKDGVYNERDKRLHFNVKKDGKIKVGSAIKKGEEEKYDPEWIDWAVFLKFVRGDPGDNIFSAYPRANIRTIRRAFEDRFDQGYEWNNFMLHRWSDHNDKDHRVKACFERNKELIDLTMQPIEIKMVMDDVINEATAPRNISRIGFRFLKYAGQQELVRIADNPGDYIKFLSAKYA